MHKMFSGSTTVVLGVVSCFAFGLVDKVTGQAQSTSAAPVALSALKVGDVFGDGLAQTAAFITPADSAVSDFTRTLLSDFEQDVQVWGTSGRHLLQAMVLFEGLKQHGVGYMVDANTPNTQRSTDRAAVDRVQYPAEVLHTKAGDYDDLTVLFCSLLENAGIATALVGDPGAIFLLFDSGISPDQAHKSPLGEQRYLILQNRLWIPLKITQLRASFLDAWQAGVAHTGKWTGPELKYRVVETAVAWQQYPPSAPKFIGAISPPERDLVAAGFLVQFETLQRMADAHIDALYLDPLKREPPNDALITELLKAHLELGQYDAAISKAQDYLLEGQGDKGKALNLLGVAYFQKGDPKQAALHFKQALEIYPDDKGVEGNLARALEAVGWATPKQPAAAPWDTPEVESFYWIK